MRKQRDTVHNKIVPQKAESKNYHVKIIKKFKKYKLRKQPLSLFLFNTIKHNDSGQIKCPFNTLTL